MNALLAQEAKSIIPLLAKNLPASGD